MDPQAVLDKIIRLARLDTRVFDEVRADVNHTLPAIVVAAASTLIFGFGGFLWWVFKDNADKGDVFIKSVILGSLFAIGLWFVWVFVVYALLTSMFKRTADVQALIRTMGYATVPLAIGLLTLIPVLGFAFALTAVVLLFVFTNYAIQSATNAPADSVLIANGAGFLIWAVVLSLLTSTDDPFGPGIFLWNFLAEAIT